jgi:hypothetical protein
MPADDRLREAGGMLRQLRRFAAESVRPFFPFDDFLVI